jgi:transcriptional regulator with PAS, ATPase and Fis domain
MGHRSKATDRLPVTDALGDVRTSHGLNAGVDSPIALRAAQSNCTILITGETGSGKGHLAQWIHDHSQRGSGPYIPVNCGAIPESLIDSQLFGHARGSFSGATTEHLGLVRAAEHGTLLLDEVSELPATAQTRLLRLLQDREVQPVGQSRPIVVDVRVIAATNVDLLQHVTERRFREDLLFRLDVIQIRVCPLRERLQDLPGLIQRFNLEFSEIYRQQELGFEPAALELLAKYSWPGNIRQVRTLIERLHVLCPGETIAIGHILEFGHLNPQPRVESSLAALERLKVEHLRQALAESGGSVSRVAQTFGVHRSTIYRWLRGH